MYNTSLLLVICIIGLHHASSQIPLRMFRKMSQCRTTQEFITKMLQSTSSGAAEHSRADLFNDTVVGSVLDPNKAALMANRIATPDVCEPRPTSVPIPLDSDPRVIYWPTCVKLERCGGCCGVDLLECAPTAHETVTIQVMKQRMSSDDSNRYEYEGNLGITLEQHTACECRCRIKSHDCTPDVQYYDEATCSCRCNNALQATSCRSPKRWDSKYCRCVCPVQSMCLDDEVFDYSTCQCVPKTSIAAAAPFVLKADPCANVRCRAGLRPTAVGTSCQCRYSN